MWSAVAHAVKADVVPALVLIAAVAGPFIVLSLLAKRLRRHVRRQRIKYKQAMARHR